MQQYAKSRIKQMGLNGEGRIRIIDLPQLSFASPAGLLVRSNTTFTAPMKAFCREIRLVCRRLKTQGA